jgi:hypothetical protein
LFDPAPATGGRVLEGRVEGDRVIVDVAPASRRTRPT